MGDVYGDSPSTVMVPAEWREKVEKAVRLAAVFDDGGDGADAESARGVVSILKDLLTTKSEPDERSFQSRVAPWVQECFGPKIAGNREERNHRFLEESLELVQACECTADEAHKLVDYVFGRPVGERFQEVGGVHVTLALLCLAQDIEGHAAAEAELERISQPDMVVRIREKQKSKPAFSPLPGIYPDRPPFPS